MNQTISDLCSFIEDKSAKMAVIGLGYVGLPVACLFAKAGFQVWGIRRNPEKVELINRGILPIDGEEPGLRELLIEVVGAGHLQASVEYAHCRDAQVVLVAVETPIDPDSKLPDYTALRGALTQLAENLAPSTLVIIESTIAPGTMKHLVQPLLEERSGLRAGMDFWLANCPERVMPGKLLHNLQYCSRVIGTSGEDVGRAAVAFYRQIVRAELDVVDCLTAEIVKTAENAYRDVQIAFANELALFCESVGADVWQVRELVNKSPGRQMHLPGGGVGGHCIPKDPWLLLAGAGDGFVPRVIPAARKVNDGMPLHIADLVVKSLETAGRRVEASRVAVLGYTYMENTDDTRNSPSQALVDVLEARGATLSIHDPYISQYAAPLEQAIQASDCLVFMVAHDCYRKLDLTALAGLMRTPVIVDARRVFDPSSIHPSLRYRCIGTT